MLPHCVVDAATPCVVEAATPCSGGCSPVHPRCATCGRGRRATAIRSSSGLCPAACRMRRLGRAAAHSRPSVALTIDLTAAMRTQDAPQGRSGPNRRLRCGREARPKPPALRLSTRRPTFRPRVVPTRAYPRGVYITHYKVEAAPATHPPPTHHTSCTNARCESNPIPAAPHSCPPPLTSAADLCGVLPRFISGDGAHARLDEPLLAGTHAHTPPGPRTHTHARAAAPPVSSMHSHAKPCTAPHSPTQPRTAPHSPAQPHTVRTHGTRPLAPLAHLDLNRSPLTTLTTLTTLGLQKQPSSPHLPLPDYVDAAAVLDEIRAGARLAAAVARRRRPEGPTDCR